MIPDWLNTLGTISFELFASTDWCADDLEQGAWRSCPLERLWLPSLLQHEREILRLRAAWIIKSIRLSQKVTAMLSAMEE